ncbi:MAG: 3-deoxy-D-manno-octulosonic acid transferase [Deltaproteobacteria bacterium]|nr:3-deoxy-D-manno-octulosonic acid transferase [Deltaproteobacteria bacterium]
MKAALLAALYRAAGAAAVASLRLAAQLAAAGDEESRRLRWGERLGRWRGGIPSGAWVWVHAASVGEARIAAALVEALEAALGGQPRPTFVVTCQTPTGRRTARAAGARIVHYFPIDAVAVMRPILTSGRLLLYVSIETELWPVLLAELGRAGIASAIANARISHASLGRYRRVRELFAPGLAGLAAVCARDAVSAERLVWLGVPEAVVSVTGDIKFDLASGGETTRKPLLPVDPTRPLLVAASTHAGEEEVALDAFARLRRQRPHLRLALAPRHPERSTHATAAAAALGLRVTRLSEFEQRQRCAGAEAGCAWDVLVVDSVGRLREALAGAAAAFVGGSLVRGPGGHNLLEIVGAHLRVITGPYLDNVAEQVQMLEEADAITIVRDAGALASAWAADLADPQSAAAAAARAGAALAVRRGALAATVAILAPLIRARSAAEASR